MADWTRWIEAAAPALGWPPGYFVDLYQLNRLDAAGVAIESGPVAVEVEKLIADQGTFHGRADTLLDKLGQQVGDDRRRAKGWPKTAHHPSGRLRRVAPALKRAGIAEVTIGRTMHGSEITIRRTGHPPFPGTRRMATSVISVIERHPPSPQCPT